MSANRILHFELSTSGRSDGTIEAVYIRVRDGAVARTEEVKPDVLMCDYDADDNLVGIEILAPVKISSIVKKVDAPSRPSFKRFVKQSAPGELVTA